MLGTAGLEFHRLTCCMHTKTLCLFIHSATTTESQDACVPLVTLGLTYCTWVFPLGLGAVWLLASDTGLPEEGSHTLSVNEPAASTQHGIDRWGSPPGCGYHTALFSAWLRTTYPSLPSVTGIGLSPVWVCYEESCYEHSRACLLWTRLLVSHSHS